jgi:hypothetical protein
MAKKATRKRAAAAKALGGLTTLMLGEEGHPTTLALGEEHHPTTLVFGEEGPTIFFGEHHPTTLALGEEGPTIFMGEHPPSNPLIENPSNVIAEQFGGIIDPGGPVERQKVTAAAKTVARKRKKKK